MSLLYCTDIFNSVGKRGYIQKELKLALNILDEFPPEDIYVLYP